MSHLHYHMATKIIHFMLNGRLEQAEFGAECSTTDVKGKKRLSACCTATGLHCNLPSKHELCADSSIICCFLHSFLCISEVHVALAGPQACGILLRQC